MATSDKVRVGIGPLSDLVLYCEVCEDVFARNMQNSTVADLRNKVISHHCLPADVALVELAKKDKLESRLSAL